MTADACSIAASNSPDACKKVPPDMNARSACEQMQERSTEVSDSIRAAAAGATLGMSAIGEGLGKLFGGSDAETKSEVINNIRVEMDTKSMLDQMSKCEGIIQTAQSNVLKGMTEDCVKMLLASGLSSTEIGQMTSIKGIAQTNSSNSVAKCKIDMVMDALSNMDVSIDNAALQKAITSAEGLGASAATTQKTCNDISVNMSACKYLSQQQCCSNKIITNQQNLLDVGCSLGAFSDIVQSNENEARAACEMSATSTATDELIGNLKNKVEQDSETTATGLTLASCCGTICSLVCPCVVILGIAVAAEASGMMSEGGDDGYYSNDYGFSFASDTSQPPSKKMSYAVIAGGFMLMFVGAAILFLKWMPMKHEQITRTGDPFGGMQGYQHNVAIHKSGMQKTTLGKAKEILDKNQDVIGFDFFADVPGDLKPR